MHVRLQAHAALETRGWIFILVSSGAVYILSGFALLAFGIVAYLWRARARAQWPFAAAITK
jgi:fructoselysine transporter